MDETDGLHRYRGGAGDAPAADDVLENGPQNREGPYAVMSPERAVLGGDDRLGDPVVPVDRVERTAVYVALSERDAKYLAGVVPEDDAAWIALGFTGVPVNGEPRRGQERGGRADEDCTSPPRSCPAERNRPPKRP